MHTFLLICILIFSLLALGSAAFSYLALKGSAKSADLATSSQRAAHQAAEHAENASHLARTSAMEAGEHSANAEGHALTSLAHSNEASTHADDAALALGEMKPETVTIVDARTGEPLFHYPEIERDCE